MTRLVPALPLGAALALAACGPSGNAPGPGGVTVDEARALDEAATMIEQRRLPADAIAPKGPAPSPTEDTSKKGA